MNPGPTNEVLQRIESIEGRPAREALTALYVDQSLSIRKLRLRWYLNERTVMRLMKWFGVEPRRGSDAVKTQWINNDERRKISAETMRKTAVKQSAEGRHNRLGKTKETDEGVMRAAEKLKDSSSARRPEVRAKMAFAKITEYQKNPGAHPNAKAAPTKREQMMIDTLKQWGMDAIHNHHAPPYWIDAFIPDLNVGIECFSKSRCRTMAWERHAVLTARGIRLLYVSNGTIDRGGLEDLHQYLSNLKIIGSNPSAQCQESVIWGSRDIDLFRNYPDDVSVKRSLVGRCYRLDITTPADHAVPSP